MRDRTAARCTSRWWPQSHDEAHGRPGARQGYRHWPAGRSILVQLAKLHLITVVAVQSVKAGCTAGPVVGLTGAMLIRIFKGSPRAVGPVFLDWASAEGAPRQGGCRGAPQHVYVSALSPPHGAVVFTRFASLFGGRLLFALGLGGDFLLLSGLLGRRLFGLGLLGCFLVHRCSLSCASRRLPFIQAPPVPHSKHSPVPHLARVGSRLAPVLRDSRARDAPSAALPAGRCRFFVLNTFAI